MKTYYKPLYLLCSIAIMLGSTFRSYSQVPPNDLCANAITISCGGVASGTTLGATIDASAPVCGPALTITAPGVWYTFIGTGDAVTVSTCNNTFYDSKIIVYSGSCTNLVCVAGNDDACGVQSTAYFNSVLSTTYYILVTGYATDAGAFDLELTCAPPCAPPVTNDNCSTAVTLTYAPDTNSCTPTTGTTICADLSMYNPPCVPFATIQDVWYQFNTGTNTGGMLLFDTITAMNTCAFAIYRNCPDTAIACGALNSGGYAFFSGLNTNTTYWLQIINYGGPTNTGTFTICLVTPPPPPANDNCPATPVSVITNGPTVNMSGTTWGATTSPDELAVFAAPAVWHAVTLTDSCNTLTVDYCGTLPGNMIQAFIVYTDCPVTMFIQGTFDFSTCGDGNATITFPGLPAGTYNLPIFAGSPNNPGPYLFNAKAIGCTTFGIQEPGPIKPSMIYPNPASDALHLKLSGNPQGTFRIINELGQVVLSEELRSSFSIANLPAGIYMVQIQTDLSTHSERLIIVR